MEVCKEGPYCPGGTGASESSSGVAQTFSQYLVFFRHLRGVAGLESQRVWYWRARKANGARGDLSAGAWQGCRLPAVARRTLRAAARAEVPLARGQAGPGES